MQSLLILLVSIVSTFAVADDKESTMRTTACYTYKAGRSSEVELKRFDHDADEMRIERNRTLKSLTAQVQDDQSGKVVILKAQVERVANKGLKGYEKTVKENYSAYLICENENLTRCYGECDGGEINLVDENEKSLSFTSDGVRLISCGDFGRDVNLSTLRTLKLKRSPDKACR